MTIEKLRRKIDLLDARILGLLNDRAKVSLDIGKAKKTTGRSVYVPEREKDVYEKLASNNKGPLTAASLRAIFREVMSSSLSLEKQLLIAYLGPELTFTHMAGMKKFGMSVDYVGCETISDVFAEVEKGRADYGVVPIENSIEGAVNHTLDMFVDSDLRVCSEVYLEISHSLMSNETDKSRITKVYSKSEVFAQCRSWLEANLRGARLVEASSTAKAASICAGEKRSACIASEIAAKKYRLKVLSRGIEDSAHNVTRFLVIGRNRIRPTGHDRTSVMFSVKDRSGALHDMLVPFKRHGINLTKIESRPSKVRPWEYYFFVDMEGHEHNAKVAKALAALGRSASFVKVLGSYPTAEGKG
mgnify:CR=1 FL=1